MQPEQVIQLKSGETLNKFEQNRPALILLKYPTKVGFHGYRHNVTPMLTTRQFFGHLLSQNQLCQI